MLSTRVISGRRSGIIDLVPVVSEKRYDFTYREGASKDEVMTPQEAQWSTVVSFILRTLMLMVSPFQTIRGDRKDGDGHCTNSLRRWKQSDFRPAPSDSFRSVCIASSGSRKRLLKIRDAKRHFSVHRLKRT